MRSRRWVSLVLHGIDSSNVCSLASCSCPAARLSWEITNAYKSYWHVQHQRVTYGTMPSHAAQLCSNLCGLCCNGKLGPAWPTSSLRNELEMEVAAVALIGGTGPRDSQVDPQLGNGLQRAAGQQSGQCHTAAPWRGLSRDRNGRGCREIKMGGTVTSDPSL